MNLATWTLGIRNCQLLLTTLINSYQSSTPYHAKKDQRKLVQ